MVDTQKSHTIRLYGTVPDSIVDGPGLRFAVFVQGCTHACPGCHNPKSQPSCGGEIRPVDDLLAEIEANKLAQGVTLSGGEPFEQAAACAEIAKAAHDLGLSVWTYSGYRYEDLSAIAKLAPAATAELSSASIAKPAPKTDVESSASVAKATAPDNAPHPSNGSDAGSTPTGYSEHYSTPQPHESASLESSVPCSAALFAEAPPSPLPAVDPAGARDLLAYTDVLVDGPFVQKRHSYQLPWRGSTNQRLIDIASSRAQGNIVLWHTHEDFPEKPASW